MKKFILIFFLLIGNYCFSQNYPIVDTDVKDFYDDASIIANPSAGQDYYGQDAHYQGNKGSYTDNEDGTITDNVTGLIWQKEMGDKISYSDAFAKAEAMNLGGYSDWRVPSIKELYSLIRFTGQVANTNVIKKFIDTVYFNQPLGDLTIEREIDAQTWSSTQYVGLTMNNDTTVFGVNFLDGRIKGYPKYKKENQNQPNTMYFRMVRGNVEYGKNNFVDNGDGTITDKATGLMWQKADDGVMRDWKTALQYAENLTLAGNQDWRLPNAKELQSLVDYSRSPQTTNSAAIDPIFSTTEINDPNGNSGQYPYFWSSTTHLDGINPYSGAAYVAFGEAQGKMNETLMDVHGAGSQRSDPKSGNANLFPDFHGPQGDVRYVYNAVRCVRNVSGTNSINENIEIDFKMYPNPTKNQVTVISNNSIKTISIYNAIGKKVKEFSFNEKKANINISELQSGIYFVNIYTNKGENIYKKLIKP